MNTFSKSTFISKLIGQTSNVGVEKKDSGSKSSKSQKVNAALIPISEAHDVYFVFVNKVSNDKK
jgi:hypothetical protein